MGGGCAGEDRLKPLFLVLLFICPTVVLADPGGPRLPCGTAPSPIYSAPGARPNIGIWTEGELGPVGWPPPSCAGWPSGRPKLLVALAASFRSHRTVDDLLARIGAISLLRGVRYWSVTDKAWQPLVMDASALQGPDAAQRRPDFSTSELRSGELRYYSQHDNRSSGDVVYRMRVRESSSARIVVETENVTAVRFHIVSLFEAQALRSLLFLDRLSPGIWGVYDLTRVGEGAMSLAVSYEASYINRAAAIYRHIAGIPTDQEPPAAP
jgi:hypothetical protein